MKQSPQHLPTGIIFGVWIIVVLVMVVAALLAAVTAGGIHPFPLLSGGV